MNEGQGWTDGTGSRSVVLDEKTAEYKGVSKESVPDR